MADEPQFGSSGEDNGFPDTEFSPSKGDGAWADGGVLILESYTVPGEIGEGVDVSNIVNRVVHGSSYDNYESYIIPGIVNFEAYWGWWTDTGSGDQLQEDKVTQDDDQGDLVNTAQTGSPNGAIDDDDDEDNSAWDEFIARGSNNAASLHGQCLEGEDGGSTSDTDGDGVYSLKACQEDEMFVFVQPGTQNMHINTVVVGCACPVAATLSNSSDDAQAPDFIMEWNGNDHETWRQANGFGRYVYDQSLLMSTIVTTSVDPQEDNGLYKAETAEAFDKDPYSAVSPDVETLYRTAVWDPNDDVDGPTDGEIFGQEGVKEYAKEGLRSDVNEIVNSAFEPVNSVANPVFETANGPRGDVDDLTDPANTHEPNTEGDQYGFAADGTTTSWATHDPATTYGDDDDYYKPGSNQDYDGYQTEEHLWADGHMDVAGCPLYMVLFYCYGPDNFNVGGIDTNDPQSQDEAQGTGPHILYLWANVGTWYDANGDTWVGNASDKRAVQDFDTTETDEDDPYAQGLVDDPNSYGSSEFRGTCSADVTFTVVPNTPGQTWGTTGAYVFPHGGNPYTVAAEDATGGAGAEQTKPVRNESPLANYLIPGEDTDETSGQSGQLSRYVLEGPIEIGTWCSSTEFGSGEWEPAELILVPGGTIEYDIQVTLDATITDTERTAISEAGNPGASLTGESIRDVDYFHAFLN